MRTYTADEVDEMIGRAVAREREKQAEQAKSVGEIVLFGDHKEVSWAKGKMPPLGSKLYTAPPPRQPLTEWKPIETAPFDSDLLVCTDAHAVLNRTNKRTKAGLKRIHIVRYIDDHDGARTYPRAVFAMGDKPDAKKPKADQLAVKRRYYARLKSRTTMNSVFNLGMQWRAA